MMNLPQIGLRRDLWLTAVGPAVLVLFGLALGAQNPPLIAADAQREAMRKLSFLVGRWRGPVTVVRGPGEPLHLTQSENVESRLDGLVLLIEGTSTAADGTAPFEALATIGFDEATHSYRIRAYNEGHYLDTELTVLIDGFSWAFAAGPAHIVNTMHLTGKGQWQESTEVAVGDNPPRKSVEMLLDRQQ
jgi:hypothetical protein